MEEAMETQCNELKESFDTFRRQDVDWINIKSGCNILQEFNNNCGYGVTDETKIQVYEACIAAGVDVNFQNKVLGGVTALMMISQHACKPQRCYELLFEAGAAETINVKHLNYKHTAL